MPTGFQTLPKYLSDAQKLAKGIWPWTSGIRARLPEHYKTRYIDKHTHEPPAIHYRHDQRKYIADAHGQPQRVQNVPLPLFVPYEADKGLWGGEAFVVGLRKRKNNPMKPRTPQIWRPMLTNRVFYSEILDKWMSITVTPRTMDCIDEAAGFDNYILKTHEAELCSALGMALKREMLMSLANKSLYPNDPDRREAVYKKYEHFIIPTEEIEWLGLSIEEAERKFKHEERKNEFATRRPLKEVYLAQLIQDLKNQDPSKESSEESASLVSRLNPFKS